jgi:hypothetical protein
MPDQPDLQIISGRLERGEINSAQYLDQLMRFVSMRIGCPRAGLRLLVDGAPGPTMRCAAMFDATLDRMVNAADITHGADEPYIEHLLRDGSVTAARAPGDPLGGDSASTALGIYMAAAGITALMDMGFSVNGVLFGAFSCEQVDAPPVEWNQRQLQSLRKIAARASLSLMHVLSMSVDTTPGALWETTNAPTRLATLPMPLDPTES